MLSKVARLRRNGILGAARARREIPRLQKISLESTWQTVQVFVALLIEKAEPKTGDRTHLQA